MPVETKYYDDLQVTPVANTEQIAQAYRRLSLQLHPLRNAQTHQAYFTTKFSTVSEAYEVLSSPVWKDYYDRFGMESLRNGVASGEHERPGYHYAGNPFKIFYDFFGSENPWFDQIEQVNPIDALVAEAESKARAEDVEVTCDCSLYEFYNGALKTISYQIRQLYGGSEETFVQDKTINITVKPGYGEHTTLRFAKMGN
jgi:DnaJ family protein A protein 2